MIYIYQIKKADREIRFFLFGITATDISGHIKNESRVLG